MLSAKFLKKERRGKMTDKGSTSSFGTGFLVGAFIFASLVVSLELGWIVLLVIITPIIHWVASACGYLLKVKKEPW